MLKSIIQSVSGKPSSVTFTDDDSPEIGWKISCFVSLSSQLQDKSKLKYFEWVDEKWEVFWVVEFEDLSPYVLTFVQLQRLELCSQMWRNKLNM